MMFDDRHGVIAGQRRPHFRAAKEEKVRSAVGAAAEFQPGSLRLREALEHRIAGNNADCDLRALLYPAAGDESSTAARLADTEWAQVALVTIQLATAALWRAWWIR